MPYRPKVWRWVLGIGPSLSEKERQTMAPSSAASVDLPNHMIHRVFIMVTLYNAGIVMTFLFGRSDQDCTAY